MNETITTTKDKRFPRGLVVTAIIAGLLIVVIWFGTRPDPVKVLVHEVGVGSVQSSVSNTRAGTLDACRRARISATIGGQLIGIKIKKGDRVRAGQVLLELWNEDVTAGLELARQESIAAKAKAEDTCVRAEDAEREAKRATQLHKRGLTSDESRDQAVTEAKARNAACRAAQASLQVTVAQIAVRQAAFDKTILKAPFDGIVADIFPEVGEYVTPSPPGIITPPAVDLIDDSCAYVTAPIDEVDAAAIRPGMPALITLDALRDRQFKGTVRRIAPYVVDVSKQARTVDVEVVFDDPAQAKTLLTGYSADVEIILDERREALRVPTEAVLEGNRVLVLDTENQELVERTFKPGLSNWRYTEVDTASKSEIKAGDLLVTSLEREGVEAGAQAIREPNNK
jgi:HlyD family secretion protein